MSWIAASGLQVAKTILPAFDGSATIVLPFENFNIFENPSCTKRGLRKRLTIVLDYRGIRERGPLKAPTSTAAQFKLILMDKRERYHYDVAFEMERGK
jgi:hypothetical protein